MRSIIKIGNRSLLYTDKSYQIITGALFGTWRVYLYRMGKYQLFRVDIRETMSCYEILIPELNERLELHDYTFAVSNQDNCLITCNRYYIWRRLDKLYKMIERYYVGADLITIGVSVDLSSFANDLRYVNELKSRFIKDKNTRLTITAARITETDIFKLNEIYKKYKGANPY